ncbi:MAG: hypothetical protein HY685_04200 [Chloroflexi bacterium]|nr:hypothetical protein [Chloroflexota bacterium]
MNEYALEGSEGRDGVETSAIKKAPALWQGLLLLSFSVALLAGCATVQLSPTPTSEPAAALTPSPPPAGTPAAVPVILELLSPQDGAMVETGAVRVFGKARPDAIVGIEGVPVEVREDGTFQRDLPLEEGSNIIEVAASDLSGDTVFQSVVVFYTPPPAGLPFTLFYPADGLVVKEPSIAVIGGTQPDAVVGVNGDPADVSELGIFSANVSLTEGANVIEVVATDIEGNTSFRTVVVFYVP